MSFTSTVDCNSPLTYTFYYQCLIQSSFSGKVKISPQYMLDDDTIDSDESITDDDDDDDDDDTLSDLALQVIKCSPTTTYNYVICIL